MTLTLCSTLGELGPPDTCCQLVNSLLRCSPAVSRSGPITPRRDGTLEAARRTSIAPAILQTSISKVPQHHSEKERTYDNEQIHVSTNTVCAKPRRLRICSRHASKHARHPLRTSELGLWTLSPSPPEPLPLSIHMR